MVMPLRFVTLAISFTPPFKCLSEETLKGIGPFYLVSMPLEVKYPRQGVNVYSQEEIELNPLKKKYLRFLHFLHP